MGAAERVRGQEVDAFGAARVQFSGMEKRLSSPEMMNATHGQLEEYVIEQGLELQRLLLQAHMDLRAAREERVEVRGADGVRRTMTRASMRPVMTLVGEVDVERLAYQAREVPGLHPMDAALNLPREQYSHGVRRFVAENAALLSFDDVRHLLLKRTGGRVPKRQLEELAVRAAVDFDAFYAARRAAESMVEPESFRDLLVMTFDGKGIVMVPEGLRPATQKAAKKAVRKLSTRLTAGEKRNRKRMAQVAAIYTVARHGREPEDVLADLSGAGERRRPERPKVTNKRVWASVEHEPETVIEEAFREALARDPKHRRQWVVLVDGNKDQLAIINAKREELGAVRIVVDLIHVLEYLWRAAHALFGDGTKQAETWVQEQLLALLRDRPAAEIAAAMRGAARKKKLQRGALKAVVEAADYLETYADYMGYGQALAMGLPIATGVIEGACRYLVKDRMDRGGARWTLKGAEAVLRLRALRTSADFDAYWDYHLREEQRRHHAERYANAEIPNPIRPARALRSVK
jgi:hypothetical protein